MHRFACAGIIGLFTAYALLKNTDISVALVDRNQSVPGAFLHNGAATGAGISIHPIMGLRQDPTLLIRFTSVLLRLCGFADRNLRSTAKVLHR